MLEDNKHIDGLFTDGLKNLSVSPNPKVWAGINKQLLAAKKKRLVAIYIWTGVAASILLLLVIGNRYLLNQTDYNLQLNTLAENVIDDSNTNGSESASVSTKENALSSESLDVKNEPGFDATAKMNSSAASSVTKQDCTLSAGEYSSRKRNANSEKFTNSVYKKGLENQNYAFLDTGFIKVIEKKNKMGMLSEQRVLLPSSIERSTFDLPREKPVSVLLEELQVQNNLLAMEQAKRDEMKGKRWSVIGQVSSTYSSYNGEAKGSNNETGTWNLGGGARLNYAINNKFAVQTGIVYNQFGQEIRGNSAVRLKSYAVENLENHHESAFSPEREKVYLAKTSAGPVNLSDDVPQPPAGIAYSVDRSFVSSPDFVQTFRAIEIPFLLRYNLMQSKFGVFVLGGVSANLIVGNGVYDQSEGNKRIGRIDGIRTTNFSSQFSLGLEYKLNSKLLIGVEPSLKYYLNSINTSSQYQYKPYSIGLFTGLRYRF